jgi:hypothetical protein
MEADVVRWSDGLVAPSRGMADWAAGTGGSIASGFGWFRIRSESLRRAPRRRPPHRSRRAASFACCSWGGWSGERGSIRCWKGLLRRRGGRGGRGGGGEAFPVRLELAGRDTEDPQTGEMFGQAHFERLIPPDLRAQVTLHGELPPQDVRRLMEQADAAVVPSPLDNFPNTCMEAMSAGRPVIAAAAGGAAEMLEGGGGLLFAPEDAGELAGQLLELVSMGPEARAQMGREARARILSMCDDDVVLAARLEHVRGVIEEAGGAGSRMPSSTTRPRAAVIVNRGGAADEEVAPLVRAVESGGVRYAHGWVRDVRAGRGVIDVLGTPSEGSLRWVTGPIGPIAVELQLAEELELEGADGVEALRRLVAAAPGEGAVVPEAVVWTAAARARPRARFGDRLGVVARVMRRLQGRRRPGG